MIRGIPKPKIAAALAIGAAGAAPAPQPSQPLAAPSAESPREALLARKVTAKAAAGLLALAGLAPGGIVHVGPNGSIWLGRPRPRNLTRDCSRGKQWIAKGLRRGGAA